MNISDENSNRAEGLKILYFGFFNPSYPRNRVVIKGLKEAGVEVNILSNNSPGLLKYVGLAFEYLKLKKDFDFIIVGFPGHKAMFLARFLFRGKIIFDAFTSDYEGYILDRKKYKKGGLREKYYRFLDKKSCQMANLVLLDTNAHVNFFIEQYNLTPNKFKVVPVGTDIEIFKPLKKAIDGREFTVFFHGNYIPLHGTSYIIKAAKLLEDKKIRFVILGRGQTYNNDRKLAEELGLSNIRFFGRVDYEDLPQYIAEADLCLGIFGDSSKVDRVIPNKVFEYMACQKPVLTARTHAIKEMFRENENIYLCNQADQNDLAMAILNIMEDNDRDRIAENGNKIIRSQASPLAIARIIINALYENRLLSK